ncbi:hypothetical protein F5Y07DRAFT_404632 [Xylaria sp. FL0933]|nr:hypothetical protein F5Y07DRAFT_404632 [Xylaria sp. FL0933]
MSRWSGSDSHHHALQSQHASESMATDEITQRWQDASKHCQQELGDDYFALIMRFKSPDELIKEIDSLISKANNTGGSRLLRRLKPHVSQAQTFILGVLIMFDFSSFESLCIWGLITLMLQLALKSEEFLSEITKMWSDIGNSLQIFDVYKDHIAQDPRLGLILFEVLEELQKFAIYTIKNLTYIRGERYNPAPQILKCRNEFESTSQYISHRIQVVKETITAKQLTTGQQAQQAEAIDLLVRDHRSLRSLSLSHTPADDPNLPCIYLPFPANPLFYGREDILSAIEDILKPGTSSNYVPSLALWATAGMGKTQIALEYAHRQRNRGLNAIFWIDAEHESSRKKGFTEIANLLDLEGAGSSKEHDTNRLLVLRWLQETNVTWLLIFDNVEDQRALTQIWPSGGRGAIIITCRSELLAAATPSGRAMEVLPFNNAEGGELLLRQIGADIEDKINKDDSMELSDLLGGHAISLNVMARSIKARKKPLGEFVKAYKENPRSLHKKQKKRIFNIPNPYYDKSDDLESLWEIPFSELEPDEARVLGIMAVCAPSNIPITVFKTKALNIDSESVDDILLGLRSLCLIGTNENATLYSVHRLIQGEYRHFIGIDEEIKSWEETVSALRELFPKQHKGFTLFNEWRLCESLIDHVETLALRYRDLSDQLEVKYNEDFAYMIADASRYLAEIGRYNACTNLLGHGFHHCKGADSIPYTNLCAMMGQVCCERGQDRSALKYNDIVLRIRESQFGPMHSEVANALSNAALSMVGCGQDVETALSMLKRSLTIDLANPLEDHKKVLHLRHFNIAFALRALGRLQEASQHVDLASAYAIAEFGENSRYLTISHRLYADIALHESAHERAYQHAAKSHAIAKLAGATTPWVAAALYYMGDIRLKQNRPREAIYLLNQARVISQNGEREKTDAGESARVLNKLSQAYKANMEPQRSHELQRQANAMYEQLIKTGEYTVSDDERDKWDYLVCLKFR